MIIIDNTSISDDVADQFFVCHLEKCKGACCIEGQLGAPLEEEELPVIDTILEKVKPFLTQKALAVIEKQGPYVKDSEGEYSTSIINGRECVFAVYDAKGYLKCGIEQAQQKGLIDFKKPISCHLYPVRVTKYEHFEAVNYDRWYICNDACRHGEALGVPVYKFLKEPLIRKYGVAWYKQLTLLIETKKS